MRVLIFLVLLVFCASCQFFSIEKGRDKIALDTIINFTKVDVSPSFLVCKDKIDEAKINCFRETIHLKIAENLALHQIKIKDSINEIVQVKLVISSEGRIKLQQIDFSKKIQEEIPKLDSLLKVSIHNLPKIYPAIKRGIPVTTQYNLPINIILKE